MGSALWIAISGLNASSKELDVIGNNIANSNTMGFKAGKTYFANVLSQSLSGGSSGMMQIGQGVTVADVATQFSQGSLESTASGLDLAIDGGGFFITQNSEGSQYYTRAGAMHIDGNGYLVDINNYRSRAMRRVRRRWATSTRAAPSRRRPPPRTFPWGSTWMPGPRRATRSIPPRPSTIRWARPTRWPRRTRRRKGAGYWGCSSTLDGNAEPRRIIRGEVRRDGNLDKVYSSTATGIDATAGPGQAASP